MHVLFPPWSAEVLIRRVRALIYAGANLLRELASSKADRQPLAELIPFHLKPLSSHHLFVPQETGRIYLVANHCSEVGPSWSGGEAAEGKQ